MLDSLHHFLRMSHVTVGFVGLVLFWFPTLSKKGGRLHIATGKAFVACGYYMVATAFLSCTWGLISPTSFAPDYTANPENATERIAEIRFFYTILIVVASWVLQDLVVGLQALKVKRDEDAMRRGFSKPVCVLTGAINFGAVVSGVLTLSRGGGPQGWILVVLGMIGLSSVVQHFQFMRNPRATRMAWWYKHMECMMGVGVGFYTAFFVFGASRMFAYKLSGGWAFFPWVLPAMIGAPAVWFWTRYYKKKFGELTP